MASKPLPPITVGLVSKLSHRDLHDGDMALYRYCIEEWSKERDEGYLKKEISMLRRVPKKLGYYYLIHRFAGEWGNGGMQSVALDYDPEANAVLLRKAAEAHRFYGDLETADLIERLIPISLVASKKIAELEIQNAPDPKFDEVWATIDTFDPLYEKSTKRFDVYRAIVNDMHSHPEDYVP